MKGHTTSITSRFCGVCVALLSVTISNFRCSTRGKFCGSQYDFLLKVVHAFLFSAVNKPGDLCIFVFNINRTSNKNKSQENVASYYKYLRYG